jgi:hypothetical protein
MLSRFLKHPHCRPSRAWKAAPSAALLVLVACTGPEPCGPEVRLTTANGEVRDSTGAALGWAEVSLREELSSERPILNVGLLAGPAGSAFPLPVSEVRLLGAEGAMLATVPFTAGGGGTFRFVTLADSDAAALVRNRLLTGAGQLEVATADQPSRRLTAALRLREARGWQRVICE